ncbi:MAG: hypothetical protein M3680_22760, partial [Myxococcota bacterium]|nr:hypothetical protein [Myxococcota bacterium]
MSASVKTKALCVATRCTSAEQFVASFHRFCDAESFFVATLNLRPVGLETPFSIQLADRTPVLRGLCVVLAAWTTPANEYKRPGIRLGIKRLTPDSEVVFAQLTALRESGGDPAPGSADVLSETPVPIAIPPLPTAKTSATQLTRPLPRPAAAPMIKVPARATPPHPIPVLVPP